eukprot:9189419-Alexandrium_andersonii.AAC.1
MLARAHTYILACVRAHTYVQHRAVTVEAAKREPSAGWRRCALSSSRDRPRTSDSPAAAR